VRAAVNQHAQHLPQERQNDGNVCGMSDRFPLAAAMRFG
jgi:ABC-type uncharacterized transport system substrate-binding protein